MKQISKLGSAIILLILQTSNAKPNKSTAPAVFEVINEQAKIDDKRPLPYENPLAGNSLKHSKIHAQHQQAMFNAEKYRQHRAQVQRWNDQPPKQIVDSYMKAYQESQENHQLALEQSQSTIVERKVRVRPEQKRTLKDRPQIEPSITTTADSVTKNRNHRSYGSVRRVVVKKRKIHTYPGPTYDQGVTIKPNGNIGLSNYEKEHITLYTEAIPSKSQYDYPKMQAYQSANDINVLNTLFSKQPQIKTPPTQFKNLIHTQNEAMKDTLNTPIDLFFYHKDSMLANGESVTSYPGPYSNVNHKDHTPITEEVDDIEDNRDPRVFLIPSTIPTNLALVTDGATTQKNIYYKTEVKQPVSGPNNQKFQHVVAEQPSYASLKYETPLNVYRNVPSTEGVKYLKTQPTGVQHLNQDGTGVSAYGDDDVSIKNNRTKRELDTNLYIIQNFTLTNETYRYVKSTQPSLNETFINLNCIVNCSLSIDNGNNSFSGLNTFVYETDGPEALPTPVALKRNKSFQSDNIHNVGEAYDYDYSYDEDNLDNAASKFDYSEENDYDIDYEAKIPDYDYTLPPIRPKNRPNRHRKPDTNKDIEFRRFLNQFRRYRHTDLDDYHPELSTHNYDDDYYGPLHYGAINHFGSPSNSYGQTYYGPPAYQKPLSIPNFEYGASSVSQVSNILRPLQPVYMLTHSQIKELLSAHKTNIEHLDVFQLPQSSMLKPRYPRYPKHPKRNYRKKFPKNGGKYKLGRIRKLKEIVRF